MIKIINLIKNKMVFVKYLLASGFAFILDQLLFTILVLLLRNRVSIYIAVAVIISRAISSFFNYLLNRNKVFKANGKNKIDINTLFKYYILVVIQACVSAFLVGYLNSIVHVHKTFLYIPIETLIKIPVEIVLFIVNYFIQRLFIFNGSRVKIKINCSFFSALLALISTYSLTIQFTSKGTITDRFDSVLISLILCIALYKFYKIYKFEHKGETWFKALALIFSLLMILGYSYDKVGNASLVFGSYLTLLVSLIKLIGFYYLFDTIINCIYHLLCHYKIKDVIKNNRLINAFNKHPMLVTACIILLCYLPYIIAYYPAIMGYDPANQIKEFMGMHTRYMDSVILLDPNITITNFNPVIHTLLLGGCFKLGHLLGSDNLGLFFYSIIQLTIVISCLAYSIKYMKEQGLNNKILFIIIGIYSLVPMFPFYALSTNKDTIFCCFVLLYCISLYDLIHNEQNIRKYILLCLCMLMVTITRNNGIYTILLSMPFTLIWMKGKRKAILGLLVIIICCYVSYNKVLLPTFKISNTSVRELLSIPFQQTARYAKYYPEDFSDEDIKTIDKILIFDTLAKRYDPKLSDPVKNKYNIHTTNKDLLAYFKVWWKGLLKRPDVYIDATVNNVYGYFYPDTNSWYLYYKYNDKLKKAGFDYHYNSLSGLRKGLSSFGNYYPHIPILGLFVNIAIVGWIYLFLFIALIVKKAHKYIPFVLPSLSFIMVNIAGPANTYFRYALPYIMCLPVVVGLLYLIFNDNELKGKKDKKCST